MFSNFLYRKNFSQCICTVLVSIYFTILFSTKEGIFAVGDVRPNWISEDLNLSDLDLWLNMNLGRPNEFSSGIALWILWNLGHTIKIDPVIIDNIIHIISRIIAFWGASRLFGLGISTLLIPQLAAVYYVMHIEWITNPLPYAIWSRALLPWVLFYGHQTINNSEKETVNINNILKLSWALFFLITQTSENLAQTIVHVLVILYLILYFRSEIFKKWKKTKKLTILSAVIIIINLPNIIQLFFVWFMPVIFKLAKIGISTDTSSWEWTQINYSTQQILKFTNYWYFDQGYFANFETLNSHFQQLINIAPLICYLFILSVNSNKIQHKDLFCLSSILILITIQGGKHPPLATVGGMMESIPGFFILREPSTKLGVYLMLIYGFLIVRSHELLYRKHNIINPQNIYIFVLMCTILLNGVLLNHKAIFFNSDAIPIKLINITSDMIKMRESIHKLIPNSERTLVIPSGKACHYMQRYSWGYYGADFLFSRFLHRNAINSTNEPYFITNEKTLLKIVELENIFLSKIDNNNKITIDYIMAKLNDFSVNNLAIRKDFQCESIADAETLIRNNNDNFTKLYENNIIIIYNINYNKNTTNKSCSVDIKPITPSIMWFVGKVDQMCDGEIIVPITFHPGWLLISDFNIRENFLESINKIVNKKILFVLPSEYDGYLRWQLLDWSYGHIYWIVFIPTLMYWGGLLGSIIVALIFIYRNIK